MKKNTKFALFLVGYWGIFWLGYLFASGAWFGGFGFPLIPLITLSIPILYFRKLFPEAKREQFMIVLGLIFSLPLLVILWFIYLIAQSVPHWFRF
jgi:hypothetical protein